MTALSGHEVPFPLSEEHALSRREPIQAARIKEAKVISLEMTLTARTLVIAAVGEFPSAGWSDVRLDPVIYIVEPTDGIYDFAMVATPPKSLSTFQLSYLTAVSVWPLKSRTVKGVRIRSATNSVVADVNGGPASQTDSPNYKSLVGKKLSYGSDRADQNSILEKDLPNPHLVIAPQDTLDPSFNPNRLDIFTDKNGVITAIGIQ